MDIQNELKQFVKENIAGKNDYSFLPPHDFDAMVEQLVRSEYGYIEGLAPNANGDVEYDDDDAFEAVSEAMKNKFSQYAMYMERMTDDYLELSEQFLTERGEIEWE